VLVLVAIATLRLWYHKLFVRLIAGSARMGVSAWPWKDVSTADGLATGAE